MTNESQTATETKTVTETKAGPRTTRRGFLQGAVLGAVGGAVAGGVGGYFAAPGPDPSRVLSIPDRWDRETDVVVIGSGGGLAAALGALDQGAKVLVLEKAAAVGGTTAIAGGGMWIPNSSLAEAAGVADSKEEALTYLRNITEGQTDEEALVTYLDEAPKWLDYVLQNTSLKFYLSPQFNDYYDYPGSKSFGRLVMPEGYGPALIKALKELAEEKGGEILLESPAKQLIVDSSNRVIGVRAETNGVPLIIKARRGVVIATGGYDWNKEMLQHYQRGPISYSSAVPTNTGDGILMGMGIGADLRNMNNSWGWPTYKTPRGGIPDAGLERGKPGSIYVNRFGERFCNEAASYPLVNRTFFVWDTRIYGYRNIPAFAIIDSEHRSRYSLAGIPPGETVPEWLRMANTLRELAGLLGIDPDGLERTVQLFNASAREGVDPEFHRGEFHFDRITAGDLSREDVNNPSLAPVEKPPFYGLEVSPGLLGTNGGLRINTKAEVRDVFGKVIPRLYATGNAAGNPFGPSYPGGGATIGFATVFGYIAGRNAAAQSSL